MKRVLSSILALTLLLALTLPAAGADDTTAGIIRLEETEGTVSLYNKSGKEQDIRSGMKLFSGNTLKSGVKSYAYISLDDTKAIKLDASSAVEIRKSGKKLDVYLVSGNIFFSVSAPLGEEETLNIYTATNVTGIRGTSGFFEYDKYGRPVLYLTTGKAEISYPDAVTGETRTVILEPGYKLVITPVSTEAGHEAVTVSVQPFIESEVPGFAAVEIGKDSALQEQITGQTQLDVEEIIGRAKENLAEEEARQEEQQKQIDDANTKLENTVVETPTEAVGEGGSEGDDPPPLLPVNQKTAGELYGGASPYTDTGEIEAYFQTNNSLTLTGSGSDTLTLPASFTLPAGKTLTLNGIEAQLSAGTQIGGALTANGGITISGSTVVQNGGALSCGTALTVDSGTTLTVDQGGSVSTQSGSTVSLGGTVVNDGTFTNAGSLTLSGQFDNNGSNTLVNRGSFTVSATGGLNNPATGRIVNESGGTLTLYQDFVNLGKLENLDGGTLEVFVNFDNKGTLENSGLISIASSAAVFAQNGIMENKSGGEVDSRGALTLNADLANSGVISNAQNLMVDTAATLTNAGTISSTGSFNVYGTLTNQAAATVTNNGSIELYGTGITNAGTITGQGGLSVSSGTLTNQAGGQITLLGGESSVAASAQLVNQGTLTVGGSSGDVSAHLYLHTTCTNTGTIQTASMGNLHLTDGVTLSGTLINQGTLSLYGDRTLADKDVLEGDVVHSAGTLTVPAGSTVTIKGELHNLGTVNIAGALTIFWTGHLKNEGLSDELVAALIIATGGIVKNSGTLTTINCGISVQSGGLVENQDNGTIDIASGLLSVLQDGELINGAAVDTGCLLQIQEGGEVAITEGSLISNGNIKLNGTLSLDLLDESLTFYLNNRVNGKGTIENNLSRIEVAGMETISSELTINNGGFFTVAEGCGFSNNGTINNTNSIQVNGRFLNSGLLVNVNSPSSVWVSAGAYFANQSGATIENHGTITVDASAEYINNGNFTGTEPTQYP